jgi:uncharacterized protein (TIGR00251 family)
MAELRKPARNNTEVILTIRVVPRSSKISFAQESITQYKVRLTSPPVDGAANQQLIDLLSKKLSLPIRNIQITHGEKARLKHVKIEGMDAEMISRLLLKK